MESITVDTQTEEFEGGMQWKGMAFEDLKENYELLKEKFVKLYREHNFLLSSLTPEGPKEDSDKLLMLETKLAEQSKQILQQQGKIDRLQYEIDSFNAKSIKTEAKFKARRSLSLTPSVNICSSVLEISADICLLNFLIHRLLINQHFERTELLDYREALHRIEDKFESLTLSLN